MPADALADRLPGLRDRLRAEPERASRSYVAVTRLTDGLRCEVTMGEHAIVIDERPSIGGGNEGASPIEAVLGVLAACQAITYRVWAATLGIRLDAVRVEVTGDIDLLGFFGLSETARAGFHTLHLDVALEGPETPERYAELADAVDRHCPVLDMAANPVAVERGLVIA